MLRLNLPIANLRAQTYDGASNMAGKCQGCQALIKTAQPLAHYTHCGAHVTHLVCAKAVESAPFIRDALNVVQELGGFYNASGKFKHLYLEQQVPDGSSSPVRLKPLCPTRWLSRGVAVRAVLANYKHILAALEEASATFGNNIHDLLSSAKCVLGLVACLPIVEILESLNTALQGTGTTVAGMLAAATVVKDNLLRIREERDKEFHVIFEAATVRTTDLQLDALSIPRKRKIPRRLDDGDGAAHAHTTVEDFYRVQYVSALDSAVANLVTYFCSTDIAGYQKLAAMLTTGTTQLWLSTRNCRHRCNMNWSSSAASTIMPALTVYGSPSATWCQK